MASTDLVAETSSPVHLQEESLDESNTMTLFVSNLAYRETDSTIQSLFAPCGRVLKVSRQFRRTEFSGQAFVVMESREAGQSAIEKLNGTTYQDLRLLVAEHIPPGLSSSHVKSPLREPRMPRVAGEGTEPRYNRDYDRYERDYYERAPERYEVVYYERAPERYEVVYYERGRDSPRYRDPYHEDRVSYHRRYEELPRYGPTVISPARARDEDRRRPRVEFLDMRSGARYD